MDLHQLLLQKLIRCTGLSLKVETVKIIVTFSKLLLWERARYWLQHRKGLRVCACVCVRAWRPKPDARKKSKNWTTSSMRWEGVQIFHWKWGYISGTGPHQRPTPRWCAGARARGISSTRLVGLCANACKPRRCRRRSRWMTTSWFLFGQLLGKERQTVGFFLLMLLLLLFRENNPWIFF